MVINEEGIVNKAGVPNRSRQKLRGNFSGLATLTNFLRLILFKFYNIYRMFMCWLYNICTHENQNMQENMWYMQNMHFGAKYAKICILELDMQNMQNQIDAKILKKSWFVDIFDFRVSIFTRNWYASAYNWLPWWSVLFNDHRNIYLNASSLICRYW